MLTKITDRVSQVRNSCRNTAEQIPGIWPRVPHGCAKKTSPKDFILVLALVLICKTYFVVRNLSRDRVNKQRLELVEFQKKKKKKPLYRVALEQFGKSGAKGMASFAPTGFCSAAGPSGWWAGPLEAPDSSARQGRPLGKDTCHPVSQPSASAGGRKKPRKGGERELAQAAVTQPGARGRERARGSESARSAWRRRRTQRS